MSVYSNKPMHICAEAFETIDKFEGFGGNVIADIEKAINHFQDQFKGIYFPVITENTVILRPDLRSNMIKPKVVSLFTYIGVNLSLKVLLNYYGSRFYQVLS